MFYFTAAGTGTTTALPGAAPMGSNALPTAMFGPGKLLSLRQNAVAITVDINGSQPVVSTTGSLSQVRYWASETVCPTARSW